MRRVTGLVLVGLGAFAFVLGLMVKFYGEPRMVRVPLNQVSGTKSVSDGNSTILDRGRVAIRSGLKLTANREVRGVVDGSKDDKTAVWRTASSLIGPAGETFRVTEERVAIDRVSGLAVNCCDEQLDGDRAVKHSGLVFKFPFDAERKTYPFWDATAKGAFPARYVGTEKRAGLDLYHFQSRVPETTISDVSVPPALVGREGTAAIEAEVVYTNTRDLWVEPRSGIIVEGREQPKQVLRAGDGSDLATVLEANIGYTPETVAKQADEAKTSAWAGDEAPAVLAVREHGMRMEVDLARGQKTGAFLDQRENRHLFRQLATGRRVLNLFSYAGGFSLAAKLGGAEHVTSVDRAAGGHASAQRSYRLNGADPAGDAFVTADVFAYLEAAEARGERWGLVVSDPPSFAPSERAKGRALGAYRALHAACARVLEPGGLFCAASCSSHVSAEDFAQTLDARALGPGFRLCEQRGLPADHPTTPAWREGRYLKFAILAGP